jgi:putative heme iron utilization protein
MEELRAQAMDVLASLSEEQVLMVIAYAQCVKDSERAIPVTDLAQGLEEERA